MREHNGPGPTSQHIHSDTPGNGTTRRGDTARRYPAAHPSHRPHNGTYTHGITNAGQQAASAYQCRE